MANETEKLSFIYLFLTKEHLFAFHQDFILRT